MRRGLGSTKNGKSSSSRPGKPELRMSQPAKEDAGPSALRSTRRLERQAQAIEEVNREAAEREAEKIAELQDRLRRRERRQTKADVRRRRRIQIATITTAVFTVSLIVGIVLYVRSIYADLNYGTGNEDLLAYVPSDSNVILGGQWGKWRGNTLGALRDSALQTDFGRNTFLAESNKFTGVKVNDLFNEGVVALRFGGERKATLIGRSTHNIDQFMTRDNAGVLKRHRLAGKTYFSIDGDPFTSLLLVSDTLLVLTNAEDEQLRQIVSSKGERLGVSPEMAEQIKPHTDLGFWLVTPFNSGLGKALHRYLNPILFQPLPAWQNVVSAVKIAQLLRVWVTWEPYQLFVEVTMPGEADAEQLLTSLNTILRFDPKSLAKRLVMTGVIPDYRLDAADSLLKNLQVGREGAKIVASTKLDMKVFEAVIQDMLIAYNPKIPRTPTPTSAAPPQARAAHGPTDFNYEKKR
jgi:hypothetical protein